MNQPLTFEETAILGKRFALRTVSSRLSILSLAALLVGCSSTSGDQMGAGGSGDQAGQGGSGLPHAGATSSGTGGVSGSGSTNAGTGGVSTGTGGTIAGSGGNSSVQGGSGGRSQTGGSGGRSPTGGSGGRSPTGGSGGVASAGGSGASGGSAVGECAPPTSYANLFVTVSGKTKAESDQKVASAWSTLFNPSGSGTIYFNGPGADESYVKDIYNNDVRSEGMSYGMMAAVQLNHQAEFDRLWTWVKNHMANGTGEIRWSCKTPARGAPAVERLTARSTWRPPSSSPRTAGATRPGPPRSPTRPGPSGSSTWCGPSTSTRNTTWSSLSRTRTTLTLLMSCRPSTRCGPASTPRTRRSGRKR